QRFGQVLVELQHIRDCARDLRHFDGVSQAIAEMIGEPGREDLRLRLKPAERTGMDDAVAVTLECVAIGMRGFGPHPPPALFEGKSQPRQHRRGDYCGGSSPIRLSAIWL